MTRALKQDPTTGPEAAAPVPPVFLDVPFLLEQSQPRPRVGWGWYGLGGFALIVMLSTVLSSQSPEAQTVVRGFAAVSMFALIAGLMAITGSTVRRQRAEMAQLEAIEELVQLRRWSEAGVILQAMLSEPTRTAQGRVQALIFLSAVLARYHRYHDAIEVQEHLLEHGRLDPGTTYGIKLGRAMAMLHEVRLFDADRAISDLRRQNGSEESGGLALIEIYRDVLTGHPREAIDIFEAKLPLMRKQLGHRVADAYALVAKAYDSLERKADASAAYASATTLAPAAELHRRYAELKSLVGQYRPAEAPR